MPKLSSLVPRQSLGTHIRRLCLYFLRQSLWISVPRLCLGTRNEEAEFWLQASQTSLDTVWDNTEDDVYAQLL